MGATILGPSRTEANWAPARSVVFEATTWYAPTLSAPDPRWPTTWYDPRGTPVPWQSSHLEAVNSPSKQHPALTPMETSRQTAAKTRGFSRGGARGVGVLLAAPHRPRVLLARALVPRDGVALRAPPAHRARQLVRAVRPQRVPRGQPRAKRVARVRGLCRMRPLPNTPSLAYNTLLRS